MTFRPSLFKLLCRVFFLAVGLSLCQFADLPPLWAASVPARQEDKGAALRGAAHNNDFKAVKRLVRRGAPLNTKGEYGETALIWAVYNRNLPMVNFLLEKGASPNGEMAGAAYLGPEAIGATALSFAIDNNDLYIVAALTKHKVTLEDLDERDETPLMKAVKKGNLALVKLLLDSGAKVDRRNKYRATPLMYAGAWPEIVNLLLERGASVAAKDNASNTPLCRALSNLESTHLLLAWGADVNNVDATGQTPLLIAVNSAPIVALLLDYRADINYIAPYAFNFDKGTALMKAAWFGRTETVRLLLERGADPNLKNRYGQTALMHAGSYQSNTEIVRLLLEHGADIAARDLAGNTPLLRYADSSDPTRIQMLLAHGARLDERDEMGETVLMKAANTMNRKMLRFFLAQGADVNARLTKTLPGVACVRGDTALMSVAGTEYADELAIMQELMQNGADVNISNENGETPLMRAAQWNRPKRVQLLLAHGAEVNRQDNAGRTALDRVVKEPINPSATIVNLLLKAGAKLTPQNQNAVKQFLLRYGELNPTPQEKKLIAAVEAEQLDQVKALLLKGVNPDMRYGEEKKTLLMTAAEKRNVPLMRLLIEKGADVHTVDYPGMTPLMYAAASGEIEAVRVLLDHGADSRVRRNGNGSSVLHTAGNSEILALLLERGADVNAQDENQMTVLMKNADFGGVDTAQLLLRYGAKLELRDHMERTALQIATNMGRAEMVRFLLDKGANIEAKDNQGNTPLITATNPTGTEALPILLERGADVKARNEVGYTALLAALGGYNTLDARTSLPTVTALLDKGSEINAQDKEGETPLILAVRKNDLPVVKLLRVRGADDALKNNKGQTALQLGTELGYAEIVDLLRK